MFIPLFPGLSLYLPKYTVIHN